MVTRLKFGAQPDRVVRPREDEHLGLDGLLRPLLYADATRATSADPPFLRCPRCCSNTVKPVRIEIELGDDYETTGVVLIDLAGRVNNESTPAASRLLPNRGPVLQIVFFCEIGHQARLVLGTHKAHTFAATYSRDLR